MELISSRKKVIISLASSKKITLIYLLKELGGMVFTWINKEKFFITTLSKLNFCQWSISFCLQTMILEAILLNFIDFFGKKFQDPIKKARNLVCSYQCAPLFHSSTSILTVSFWSSAPAQPSHSNSDRRRTETDKSEAEASHLCPYKTPFAYRANLYPSLIGQKLITCSQVDDVTGEALICVGWIWLLWLKKKMVLT